MQFHSLFFGASIVVALLAGALASPPPAAAQRTPAGWTRHVASGVAVQLPRSHPHPARLHDEGGIIYQPDGAIHVAVYPHADLDTILQDLERQGGTTTAILDPRRAGDRVTFTYRVDATYFCGELRRVGDRAVYVYADEDSELCGLVRRIATTAVRDER